MCGLGHLVCLPYDQPGKFGNKPSTLLVGSGGAITEFDVSRFDDWLAVGSEDGKVGSRLPFLLVRTLR